MFFRARHLTFFETFIDAVHEAIANYWPKYLIEFNRNTVITGSFIIVKAIKETVKAKGKAKFQQKNVIVDEIMTMESKSTEAEPGHYVVIRSIVFLLILEVEDSLSSVYT